MLKRLVLITLCALTGCAMQEHATEQRQLIHRQALFDAVTDPENQKIVKLGCSYEQVQKVLHGLSPDAPYERLQQAWSMSYAEVLQLHGLPSTASSTDLFRAVRKKLEQDGICKKWTAV